MYTRSDDYNPSKCSAFFRGLNVLVLTRFQHMKFRLPQYNQLHRKHARVKDCRGRQGTQRVEPQQQNLRPFSQPKCFFLSLDDYFSLFTMPPLRFRSLPLVIFPLSVINSETQSQGIQSAEQSAGNRILEMQKSQENHFEQTDQI